MINESIIEEIINIAKRLDSKNLVNAYEGNLSIKKDGLMYITPTTKSKANYKKDEICVLDEEGKQIHGKYKPSSEWPMHLNTYKMRDGIGAVIHCHAPYMTAHALCGIAIESRSYPEMIGNFKRIDVVPYGTPGEEGIYKNIKSYIQKRDIVLLGNHGVLVVSKTLIECCNKLEAAEAITKVMVLSKQIGTPVELEQSEIDMFFNK